MLITNYKTAVFVIIGGEGGIRTLETRYIWSAPLAGACLQPLGHFSAKNFCSRSSSELRIIHESCHRRKTLSRRNRGIDSDLSLVVWLKKKIWKKVNQEFTCGWSICPRHRFVSQLKSSVAFGPNFKETAITGLRKCEWRSVFKSMLRIFQSKFCRKIE